MAGLVFLLVSGCWRALAKGTAWAGFYCLIQQVTGGQVYLRTTRWHAATSEGELRTARTRPQRSGHRIARRPQPRRRTCRAPNHPRRRVTLSCIRGPCSLYTQGLVQYNETIRVRRLRCKSQTLHSSWSRCEYTRRNAPECTSHLCTNCNSWSAALQRLFLGRHAHVGALR